MIGSAVGGYVDPTIIQGPRLGDSSRQTAQDGIPIPFGYGTFPTAGNIIWSDRLIEHVNKKRQGKGGPVTVTYTYTRSYAIGICEGQTDGLLLIKRNGKIVYDARTSEAVAEWGGGTVLQFAAYWREAQAGNNKFTARCTIYRGTEEQLPDPTIEAVVGVGNVGANRGLCYMVVKDDDLTDTQGAIPQYEFVVSRGGVVTSATYEPGKWIALPAYNAANAADRQIRVSPDGIDWTSVPIVHSGPTPYQFLATHQDRALLASSTHFAYTPDAGQTFQYAAIPGATSSVTGRVFYGAGYWFITKDTTAPSLRSDDGVSFVEVGPPGGFANKLSQITQVNETLVASTPFGASVSNDSGATWTAVTDIFDVGTPTSGPIAASTTRVLIGDADHSNGARFAYSDDLGQSWTPGTMPFSVGHGVRNIVYSPGLALWFASSTLGEVAKSADGRSWEITAAPIPPGESCYDFATDGTAVIAACSGGTFIRYDAGGWEHVIPDGQPDDFRAVEFFATGGTEIPDSPGSYVDAAGNVIAGDTTTIEARSITLAEIVTDLCARVGVSDINAADLTDTVAGYRVAVSAGADSMIAPLMQGHFFDAAEWDGAIHFVKRGKAAAFALTMDDLADRDPEAITLERVQEAELLRKVTVGYIDPLATYSPTTQSWERRAGTVEAKGEAAVEIPIVCSAEEAARIAEKRGKVAWAETEKGLFSLPALKWAHLTPTDVGLLATADGTPLRLRLMRHEEDSGALLVEASRDRQAAYTGTASGVAPTPVVPPQSSLIGPTRLAVMDLPVLAETDDRLGVYVAVGGILGGWRGAVVQVSTDGGATASTVSVITDPANVGTTTTALDAWISSEYPSSQSLTVSLPFAPESVTGDALLRYSNRAAVRLATGQWEVLQYQAATTNEDGTYTLSGLVRGRYATTPGAASTGARFVLLDAAVQFVPIESWALNTPLKVRAVSIGTDADAAPWTDLTIEGVSQTEWAPAYVTAARDVVDSVVVEWMPRGRIGTEVAPRQSAFFAGFRVSFSDGFTVDTAGTTYTRTSTPPAVAVSVAALNSITGPGPSSEAVSV